MDAPAPLAGWTPPYAPGDPVPWFVLPTPTNPNFIFSTTAGRYILLVFLPPPGAARDAAAKAFTSRRALFDDERLAAFMVIRDEDSIARARDQRPGLRFFFDRDGAVSRTYGALDADGQAHPYWLLLDPSLRTLWAGSIERTGDLIAQLDALPASDAYAGVELFAPVLIVPRVFERELCRELIGVYEANGGSPSGVMRDVGGRTVGVLDDFKKRRDVVLEDPELRARLRRNIARRVIPEIAKVYQFNVTHLERYLVARYDAEDGGYFRPHRDNETFGTLHRKFACSINLNAEEFEGGDLRFPEFGRRTYRPPTGGAVVFACGLQHEATPVTRGTRYAFLPFFYDAAGQAIREANEDKVEISKA
ncbi:MAG: 2OG-Fe(II) oxygenase [Proteobacteria bacterium]|nr:2OG-Fe(II) oxygenase [Pseudomonadota bacterium]